MTAKILIVSPSSRYVGEPIGKYFETKGFETFRAADIARAIEKLQTFEGEIEKIGLIMAETIGHMGSDLVRILKGEKKSPIAYDPKRVYSATPVTLLHNPRNNLAQLIAPVEGFIREYAISTLTINPGVAMIKGRDGKLHPDYQSIKLPIEPAELDKLAERYFNPNPAKHSSKIRSVGL